MLSNVILLTADWGQAWSITWIGFLLVFCLLVLLVLVLMLFSRIMARASQPKETPAAPKPAAPLAADASDEEMAAIAMALYLAAGPAHDKESNKLTIAPVESSAWASKSFGINNL